MPPAGRSSSSSSSSSAIDHNYYIVVDSETLGFSLVVCQKDGDGDSTRIVRLREGRTFTATPTPAAECDTQTPLVPVVVTWRGRN